MNYIYIFFLIQVSKISYSINIRQQIPPLKQKQSNIFFDSHILYKAFHFIHPITHIKIEFIRLSKPHSIQIYFILPFEMLVSCPFCKQLLIQAYQHVQFMYAVCFTCFKHIVKHFRIFDFERVSVLREKGAQQINKLRKVNIELRHHLETNMTNFAQSMRKRIIDEYFDRQIDTRKSLQSTISTSPSFNSQMDENPQNNTKPIPQNIKEVKAKAQENSTMQKLSVIKEKLTSTGKSFIEKIKQSERYEKQVESIENYKDKIIEKSDAVKSRLSKMRGDFKEIKSELPSLKETIRGIEIGSMLKSKLFGW